MSAYNVKLIEYPNGDVQVRHYSSPLTKKPDNPYEDDVLENDIIINPFDFSKTKEVKTFSSQSDNEQRSFNRSKQKVFEYARCVPWEWFVTFTFAPDTIDRYDFSACSSVIRKWLNNQRRNAPELKYLIVPEHHKDGAYHFHGLLADVGLMKFVDSEHKTRAKEPIYNMTKWSYGFTTATKVNNIHSVSKYIGKYITKDLCCLTKGKQRYFVSSNLPKPIISDFLVEDMTDFKELLEMLCNSLGKDVVNVSCPRHSGSFVDVDYYELQERGNLYDNPAGI